MAENDTLIEYECPCCGGKIEFDSSIQKLKCPYCDTEFDVADLKGYDETLKNPPPPDEDDLKPPSSEWSEEEAEGLRRYICKSCGGEIVTDATTAATHCPFCDNPVVMAGQLAGDLKPELVIPFKLDKEAAKARLERHLSGKPLLPKVFKSENHIDEIKGIYVPFWLYSSDADADMRARGTRVRTWSDRNYIYTETSHYSISRAGSLSFKGVPVDGSTKMDDTLMESIEPFDISEAVDFQTAYLSGFFADRYDVDSNSSRARAAERMKRACEETLRGTVRGYSSTTVESSGVRLHDSSVKYALYPVWILNTSWNGEKYTFAMNGQTGKFVGDLPIDNGAYLRWLFGLTAAIGGGMILLGKLFELVGGVL